MDQKNTTKSLINIPLVNIWYVILTLIFILMRVVCIIDWSPLWILSPLWIPIIVSLSLFISIYIIKFVILGIIYLIDYFDKKKK